MPSWLSEFLYRELWAFPASDPHHWSLVYRWFNITEGAIWCLFGLWVVRRYLQYHRSLAEIAYAVAFVAFGLSDFREATALHGWLVVAKALNLAALLSLRAHVLKRHYPDCKLL